MATPFSPTPQDVENYRIVRALSMELNHEILKTIPRRAFDEIGDALGIRRHGVLLFDTEDMTSVLMDCCLYNWFEDGKNIVQRYAETHPAPPRTNVNLLLEAYLHSGYGILVAQSAVPGAGLHCQDILYGREFFLMDVALSRCLPVGEAALATRIIPLGEYCMTGGAELPAGGRKFNVDALLRAVNEQKTPLNGPGGLALAIARVCLDAGAAGHIAYDSNEAGATKKVRRQPQWPGFKRRRR